jgi:hypothetical protein
MARSLTSGGAAGKVAELRELADLTAQAALTAAPGQQLTVLEAAGRLGRFADGIERRAKNALTELAVAELPSNATVDEVQHVRRRQAVRRGADVYLPGWSAIARALPNAFLRSALFSASRRPQADNASVLSDNAGAVVTGREIATLRNMTVLFSGYELCQFDRLVYATCLDYYRDVPLCPGDGTRHLRTTFYEFARRMGNEYSVKAHRAIRASLLRLSFAQLRVRYDRMNIEVPKLLSVTFEDGAAGDDFKGSDALLLRVTTSVAELFGRGRWTSVESETARYDGLRGWLANFYAGHAGPQWLPVKTLYRLSGYKAHMGNFRASLVRALDKLKDPRTPMDCRVAEYSFTKDGASIEVIRSAWSVGANEALDA